MMGNNYFTSPHLLAVLLFILLPTAVHAVPLATSSTTVNCAGTIDGTNVLVPGFTSATCSTIHGVLGGTFGQDADAATSGLLTGTGAPGDPLKIGKAEVSSVITGTVGGTGSAGAQLLLYFDLVAIGMTPPPAGTVTINIGVSGSGSGGQYFAQARTDWGVNGAFSNELITFTSNPNPPFSDVHTVDFIDDAVTSPLDWDGLVWLTATCGTANSASCDALVDGPTFSFADLSFADYYAFNFSPNVVIPLPAAAWLLGSGLLTLLGNAVRKKAAY